MHHFIMIFETINLPKLGVWGLFKYHFGFVLTHTLDHHLNSFFVQSPMKPADGFLVCSCQDYYKFDIIDIFCFKEVGVSAEGKMIFPSSSFIFE